MSKERDVVVTGLGLLSPVGSSYAELCSTLAAGRSGIGLWQSPALEKKFPAGIVPRGFEDCFTKLELPYLDRCSQMAVIAADAAIADAGLSDLGRYAQRAGLYYGSVRGGTGLEEQWFEQFLIEHKQSARPYSVFAIMHNAGAAQISIRHQILGPVMTHSSACVSSGAAIGDACRAIRDGYVDVAVAGGAEAPLTASMFGVWDGTRVLAAADPDDVAKSCRPFSKRRGGLVLAEGAAFVVLEAREHARRRGAACYAGLAGYGMASDGYHIGSPKAEGQTVAMCAALTDAGLRPEDIEYINAHATATRGGDIVETKAIRASFGEAVEGIPVSSTKSLHGHLLGAASVLELIITIAAMTESFVPATAHLEDIDPECALNHVANVPIFGRPIERAMSFSSGLGGTNVALIVAKGCDVPMKSSIASQSSNSSREDRDHGSH